MTLYSVWDSTNLMAFTIFILMLHITEIVGSGVGSNQCVCHGHFNHLCEYELQIHYYFITHGYSFEIYTEIFSTINLSPDKDVF